MSESATEEVSVEQVKSTKEYQSLKGRVEDLEEDLMKMQDEIRSIKQSNYEQSYEEQFNEESNFGY